MRQHNKTVYHHSCQTLMLFSHRDFFALSICARSFRCLSFRLAFFLPRTVPLAMIIIIGLFLAFSLFVELLGASFFFFPLVDANFSLPSRPFSTDATRSA